MPTGTFQAFNSATILKEHSPDLRNDKKNYKLYVFELFYSLKMTIIFFSLEVVLCKCLPLSKTSEPQDPSHKMKFPQRPQQIALVSTETPKIFN
ncbi:hypothetical protein NPIL_609131 [Nephila pilipes]|uniref:Uncharacterized protein n=1 Tax=Nephila pilipes TaxID=299642 RepID=A0A8X6MN08_NEPPI|nr:hypothetical protein NPIL_609131 [Nephila pilipes]